MSIPTITALPTTDITSTGFTGHCELTSDGGKPSSFDYQCSLYFDDTYSAEFISSESGTFGGYSSPYTYDHIFVSSAWKNIMPAIYVQLRWRASNVDGSSAWSNWEYFQVGGTNPGPIVEVLTPNQDSINFTIDGNISSWNLSSGTHTMHWLYRKDGVSAWHRIPTSAVDDVIVTTLGNYTSQSHALPVHGAYEFRMVVGGAYDNGGGESQARGVSDTYYADLYTKPDVQTDAATGNKTMNGTLLDDGGETTTVWFKWGLIYFSLADLTHSTTPETKVESETFDSSILGIVGTIYFVAVAENIYGIDYGSVLSFICYGYPTNALTRVTSIIHTFDRLNAIYQVTAGMGGVLADFDLPSVTLTASEKKDEGVPVGDAKPPAPTVGPIPPIYDIKEDRLNIIKNIPPISGPTGVVPSVRQILGIDPWNPPVLHPQPGFPAPIPKFVPPSTTPTKVVGPAVPTRTPPPEVKPFVSLTTEAQKKADLLKKKTPTNAYYVNGKLIYGGPR